MAAADSARTSADGLRELLRDASVVQANQYFNGDEVKLIPTPSKHHLGQVLKTHIVMVLMTCAEMRIVLKVHFNYEQMRAYRRAKGLANESLTEKQLVDFMKELCNQMAGRVCRIFEVHQISMGMSIPLCTRGIYEIYADYRPKAGATIKFGDFWCLNGPFEYLYCSSYVELMSKNDYSGIKLTDEQSQEGELDFL